MLAHDLVPLPEELLVVLALLRRDAVGMPRLDGRHAGIEVAQAVDRVVDARVEVVDVSFGPHDALPLARQLVVDGGHDRLPLPQLRDHDHEHDEHQ